MRTTLKILILLIYSFATVLAKAQDYNYIHYTNKDGLAGNTVYGVAQDKDGYMFFATENGLSRFDGKEWKTFTVKDGLPDNEVLVIFGDSRGRIWMSCYSNGLCYYYKGKIYNNVNCNLIKDIKLNTVLARISEQNGEIFFQSLSEIWAIDKFNSPNKIITRQIKDISPIKGLHLSLNSERNSIEIFVNDSLFQYKNKSLYFIKNFHFRVDYSKLFLSSKTQMSVKKEFTTVERAKGETRFINTNSGCYSVDTSRKVIAELFLPGIKIGHTLEDIEGNIWFTTLGQGIYKLPSRAIKTNTISDLGYTNNKEIFSIFNFGKNFFGGASFSMILSLNASRKHNVLLLDKTKFSTNPHKINRVTSSFTLTDGSAIVGFDSYLMKITRKGISYNFKLMPIKSIEKINSNYLLVATGNGLFKISTKNLEVIDTLFPQRSTYANYLNHQYYVGTTNGLFVIDERKQDNFLGNINPVLKRRITCIKIFNNKVYIATADAGVVVLNNNKVVAAINDSTGLSSNSVKTLHISGTKLWVGTIKGVNKIDLNTNKVITKYSTSDGLPSDIINAIYYDNTDSTVWVGSTEGLTYFKEKDILGQSMCNLVVENITVSKTSVNRDSNNLSLKYNDNIQFQFVGISLRSGDEILYHYKLQGLDANFNTITERFLSYPSLPSGNYTLYLYATNKFGVKSKTYTCTFTVAPPFWKTWWFYTLELSVFAFIIWIILYTRFKRKQKEYKLNADFKVLLADMEQQALQAQMNPHFIFNSLNSIQQFMLQNDKQQANKYLTSFATLIRKTLDYSAKKSISLTDEIDYLNQYVALELLRFNNSFTYTINVSDDLEVDLIKIPALLLQPFVENAIRHGIRNKTSNDGVLLIEFKMQDDNLVCTIEDNGIGRKKAQEIKSTTHIEYQSKGLDITQKRITLLNTKPDNKFDIQIIDLMNDNVAIGTRVVVTIAV